MVFQLLIRKDGGETAIDVADTEQAALNKTVKELKQIVRARIGGAPVADQDILMSFAGRSMEDNKKLCYYGIEHLSIISVTFRMPGGGPSTKLQDPYTCKPTVDPISAIMLYFALRKSLNVL
ncbi:ubiquitin-40S ribosomal protein S27a-like [Astyanax mexicanus]|uniref:Ubiquitin-40S ribosomal protein S27a-like n=1 Tax=Astyanax mexicanus TaxID=7994 RepID=A0A8T2MJU8_ASTMX|nr:ubiquitin-40S ribosomal protein S27a-like [Astyanax mexicanus]